MALSLDGYAATSSGGLDWIFPNMDAEIEGWIVDSLRESDTQLLGRINYEEQARYWPAAEDARAPLINNATKIVFSSTLANVGWHNCRLADVDVAEQISQLKRQPGKDILVPGGVRFAQHVVRRGLVDEYRLIVYPVALGQGLPLFTEPRALELLRSRTFGTGAVALTYAPTGPASAAAR
jgi:dihydrofolate reductase